MPNISDLVSEIMVMNLSSFVTFVLIPLCQSSLPNNMNNVHKLFCFQKLTFCDNFNL